MNTDFLYDKYLDNQVVDICYFVGIILLGLIFKKFVSFQFANVFYRGIKKYSNGVNVTEFRELLKKPIGMLFVLLICYIAFNQLHFPPSWEVPSIEKFGIRLILFKLFQLAIAFSLTWTVLRIVDFFGLVLLQRSKLTETKSDDQLILFVKESVKFIVASMSFFGILGGIFHVNVASLIAGLGIGGLAFALAAKDTLENLLGSFTIFLDKPFILGDMVKLGNLQGKVEKIGFRSTQIRTLEKTLVTVPNKKMIDAELENISLRNMIRSLFTLSFKLDSNPTAIKSFMSQGIQSIHKIEAVHTDPAPYIRLDKITDQSIDIQILFFINTTDPDFFQITKQQILFDLLDLADGLNIKMDTKANDIIIMKNN